jgi:hypothetical protein
MELNIFLFIFFILILPCIMGGALVIFLFHKIAKKTAKKNNSSYKKELILSIGKISYVLTLPLTTIAVFAPISKLFLYGNKANIYFDFIIMIIILIINRNFYYQIIFTKKALKVDNWAAINGIITITTLTIYYFHPFLFVLY